MSLSVKFFRRFVVCEHAKDMCTAGTRWARQYTHVKSLSHTVSEKEGFLTSHSCKADRGFFSVMQFKGEFPELLGIRESLIKYVFEPNAQKVSYGAECMQVPLRTMKIHSFAG